MMFDEINFELGSILTVLKCSVHTLQLAVHDTMKKLKLEENLKFVRTVIKKLRTPKYRQFHVDNNKELYKSLYGQRGNKEIEMTEADWNFVEKYLIAFKPVFIATKELQSFQLAMSKYKI